MVRYGQNSGVFDSEEFLQRLYSMRRKRARELYSMAVVYHRGNMPELREFCESEFWYCVTAMQQTSV